MKTPLPSRPAGSRPFDFAVFIGRFEPFHSAHLRVIQKALSTADQVIVLIGSAGKPRSIKDPFFYEERRVMVRSALPAQDAPRVLLAPLHDFPYNDERWAREVQAQVAQLVVAHTTVLNGPARICLVGHVKDSSSAYLRMFPQWSLVEAPNHEQRSATDIRALLFEATQAGAQEPSTEPGCTRDTAVRDEAPCGKWMLIEASVPPGVYAFLREFARSAPFVALVREHRFIQDYRAQFAALPYPPVFVTVDAVLVHSGHILLVKRAAEPGRGLWALPGGFIGVDELLIDACIRELREETRLKLPEPVLRGSIKAQRVFDRPDRSLRGRTITHAYYFEFPSGELPLVKGGDDAAKARWVPLAEFYDMEGSLFEDHYGIATAFLGV